MQLTTNQIAAALGLHDGQFDGYTIDDIAVDSRSVVKPAATLFVALTTPNNDGHNYIVELIRRGVCNFIVTRIPEGCNSDGVNFFKVDDTLAALQLIGTYCRNLLKGKVVAITGSRGKTVVKEIVADALMRAGKRVSRSPRSYNSQIGVPLSLAMADVDADYVLIEAGISEAGEMSRLKAVIRPQIGILTEITDEHADGFASRREKIDEKLSLLTDCGYVVYDASEPLVDERAKAMLKNPRLFPVKPAKPATAEANIDLAEKFLETERINVEPRYTPIFTRLDVIEGVNNCKLIYDGFTADIPSLRLALDFMRRHVPSSMRRTLILATDGFRGSPDEIAEAMADYGIERLVEINSENPASSLATDDFYDEAIIIRGTSADDLRPLYSLLEAKQHETLMEVNLDAIVHNFNYFRSRVRSTTGVICMLKAHGYGAGSVELARTLQSQGAAYLAVAVVDEGVELRRAGISMPIIVLNPRAQNYKVMFDYRLEPEIYSFEMLDAIDESARRYGVTGFPVHIKLDTGMRRLGFLQSDMPALAERLIATDRLRASTIFSHLACADDPQEDDYTRGQFDIFTSCCDYLDAHLPEAPRRHILNSTGIIRFPEYQFDFVRLGIGLYGIPTIFDGSEAGLRNVSTLSSLIISIKQWRKGDTVGYNRRGLLTRDSVIATVPVGYADGLDRYLGYGNTSFLVNGHRCPTVGSICMDICMIDVTDVECAVGDRVEIFGDNISPIELADTLGTIPYEILTSISPRVKRIYYKE